MEDIISFLKERGITYEQDGFVTLPKDHVFATWRIVKRKAEGSDGYNMYWRVTYELRIWYRDRKNSADTAFEERMEREVLRELENLEAEYDYNSEDKLDVTIYRFTQKEEF